MALPAEFFCGLFESILCVLGVRFLLDCCESQ